ncbi:helicase-exonuclease AddAB subunit AddB [Sporolactobacillus sp. CQH2019]|uniref:helicase-exonuclease AddAB subunit AddB n=1 Tax=Sporolactobacillus sp. CQH2019 TaxID=3023512 RepID=UPI0023681108|nr:helicase-exonuclease AddAB subunit AddB [Sporolactobacillus sp. CQH2019]MDD9147309.1 helicase-exonuclease AddAB subunit AddB [Sporolactobacillus sp. CQH2019]
MSVRFILGRPGTGKTASCMEEVRTLIRENPSGSPLIYLVPDHMTFNTEYDFARTDGFGGMTRLNVFSIPRLALRVLQQSGGITRYHLNETGIAMLLRKIVEQNKDQLHLFKKAAEQSGFYRLLGDTLAEFKRYRLRPEQIAGQAAALGGESAGHLLLKDKLHDLSIVYQSFEKALAGKYIDSDDYLRLAAEKIAETDFLKNAEIWVDGFQTMTPEEQRVVGELMETSRRMTVILGIDRAYDRPPEEFSVYRHPARLFLQLKEYAEEQNLELEPLVIKTEPLRAQTPALQHLTRCLDQPHIRESPSTEGLVLTEAVNRREEVEQTARDILGLARDRGFRFRDMTVLVRNLEDYRNLIATVFADYGIPAFIDHKRPMRHHPLIELIRSALEAIQQNWRYEPVFRCVKTNLLIPPGSSLPAMREAMDELENYVMAYGIYGEKKWTGADPWSYRVYRGLEEDQHEQTEKERQAEARINRLRFLVAGPIASFEEKLKSASTVREKCTVLYDFMIGLAIPDKLERMARAAESSGRLSDAKEHGQVWKAVADMLDQCVEGAGEENISLELFSKIIDTGLDALEFALVPPALDQVLVGSMDRMRSSELKAVFLLGVNEGVIPAKPSEQGLFSDEDRDSLEASGMHVADGETGRMAAENELIFRALSLPKERLFLSFPLASEDGESLKPSPLIGRLKRLFPGLSARLSPAEPRLLSAEQQLGFVNTPRKTIGFLSSQIREWQNGYRIAGLWWDVYDWFIDQEKWGAAARRILSALFSQNGERLGQETARALYGETIQASVSRMEQFNSCPFSQFASYGLKLREREVFRLAAPDIGQLFHMAIKRMTEQIQQARRQWSDLSPEDCDRLAAETVSFLAPKLQRRILVRSSRNHYMQHKLTQVVARVARVMRRHAQASGFSPLSLELPFGPGRPLPPLQFSLRNGCRMEIVGRIDRVDKAEDADHRLLLRVIDYKSGSTDLSLTDVYYGLALQMLTYLDVVLTYSKQWLGVQAEPAGVLYFHVHNPFLRLTDKLAADALEEEIYKSFRMKGLLPQDEAVLRLTDRAAAGGQSAIAPFGIKKNGEFYKGSSVAGAEEFDALRHHAKNMMKQVGNRITDGDVQIAPYRLRERVPCTYCPYRPVCQFDRSQPGNAFRQLQRLPDDQVLFMLNKEKSDPNDHEA